MTGFLRMKPGDGRPLWKDAAFEHVVGYLALASPSPRNMRIYSESGKRPYSPSLLAWMTVDMLPQKPHFYLSVLPQSWALQVSLPLAFFIEVIPRKESTQPMEFTLFAVNIDVSVMLVVFTSRRRVTKVSLPLFSTL